MGWKSLLPEELEIKILMETPGKSLLRFRSVCKYWNFLISSDSFVSRYSCNARNEDMIMCFRKDPITKIHMISLLNHRTAEKIRDIEWPPFLDEGVENKEAFQRGISIFGPINGIYCIYNRLIERWVGTLVLWNPATKEYKHILPPVCLPYPSKLISAMWNDYSDFSELRRPLGLNLGFGFNPSSNDFKVVAISHWEIRDGPDDDRWHAKVYNLSNDSWKTINYLTYQTHFSGVLPPFQGIYPPFPYIKSVPDYVHCLLNSRFHWPCSWNYGNCEGVLAFDMTNDSFQLLKGPPLSGEHFRHRSIWVLNKTLAMVVNYVDFDGNPLGNVEVWMMMEYGVDDHWARIHSFGPLDGLTPIGIPNDDKIFFHNDKGRLIAFRFEDHELKEYGTYGLLQVVDSFNICETMGVSRYVESLVSLKPANHQ